MKAILSIVFALSITSRALALPSATASFPFAGKTSVQASISDYVVGDVLAHMLGMQPIHPAETAQLVQGSNRVAESNFFTKPMANVLLLLDGVTDVTHVPSITAQQTAIASVSTTCVSAECLIGSILGRSPQGATPAHPSLLSGVPEGTRVVAVSSDPNIAAIGGQTSSPALSLSTASPSALSRVASKLSASLGKGLSVAVEGGSLVMKADEKTAKMPVDSACARALLGEVSVLTTLSSGLKLDASAAANAPTVLVLAPSVAVKCAESLTGDASLAASSIINAALTKVLVALENQAPGRVFGTTVALQATPRMASSEMRPELVELLQGAGRRRLDPIPAQPSVAASTPSFAAAVDKEVEGITRFQIVLWLSVGLVLVLGSSVAAMLAMTDVRDPLLYTKVRPDATHRA